VKAYAGRLKWGSRILAFLALLAGAAGASADPNLPAIPSTTYNILNYGAVPSNAADNTSAIENAFNAAEAAGGGTVVVPSGNTFLCNPFSTTANNINLEVNGTLEAPTQANFGTATYFIKWKNASNIEISGSGTINGQASSTTWWNGISTNIPDLVNFDNCSTLEVTGITTTNSPKENFSFSGSTTTSNVTFNNVTISEPGNSPNTDGIDPQGSNILIKNCNISDGDDNIAVSPNSEACSNISIVGCTFGSGHGVSIGSVTTFGVNNLSVSNCTFTGTGYGIRLKAGEGTGGGTAAPVENLNYSDLTMTNVPNPIFITSYYANGGANNPNPPSSAPAGTVDSTTPVWENINISNLTSTDSASSSNAGTIFGLPYEYVQNLTFNDVNISAQTGMQIDYANVDFANSTITPASGPQFVNVYDATIAVPEPVGTALVSVAAIGLLLRRSAR
jgi:polygalacturonase